MNKLFLIFILLFPLQESFSKEEKSCSHVECFNQLKTKIDSSLDEWGNESLDKKYSCKLFKEKLNAIKEELKGKDLSCELNKEIALNTCTMKVVKNIGATDNKRFRTKKCQFDPRPEVEPTKFAPSEKFIKGVDVVYTGPYTEVLQQAQRYARDTWNSSQKEKYNNQREKIYEGLTVLEKLQKELEKNEKIKEDLRLHLDDLIKLVKNDKKGLPGHDIIVGSEQKKGYVPENHPSSNREIDRKMNLILKGLSDNQFQKIAKKIDPKISNLKEYLKEEFTLIDREGEIRYRFKHSSLNNQLTMKVKNGTYQKEKEAFEREMLACQYSAEEYLYAKLEKYFKSPFEECQKAHENPVADEREQTDNNFKKASEI